METLRRHLIRRRGWAAWVIAAALLMKLLVPAGYMPVAARGSIALELCSGHGPVAMAMPGMAGHGKHDASGRSDLPCGFAGLTLPGLAAADPILIAIAIAFVVSDPVRAATAGVAHAPDFLRPHPRGPPPLA